MSATDLSRDPIVNVVHNGIKKPIRLLLDNECYPAVVVLIYSGMDTMAFLGMPDGQTAVSRDDFVRWAERYIHFKCQEQLTGIDLYGARCSVLHTHGIDSALSRAKKCRMIGYADHMIPEVRFSREVSSEVVMVSIKALADAFLEGTDRFLVDLFSDKNKAQLAEGRFQRMHHTLDWPLGEVEVTAPRSPRPIGVGPDYAGEVRTGDGSRIGGTG